MRVVGFALSLLLGCASSGPEPPADAQWSGGCGSGGQAPGLETLELVIDGNPRVVQVWRPQGYGSDYPYPLVMMFHGAGGTGSDLRTFANLEDNVDNLAIVAYLDALPGDDGVTRWVDNDLTFFDAALDELSSTHCVDEARVFAAGFSNGGAFANGLGCARAGRVRAIASVAGGGPSGDCSPNAVAALIAHGTHDQTVGVDAGELSRDYWKQRASCEDATQPAVGDAHCSGFQGCAQPVVWCEHDERGNGGHIWPQFLDAAIWRFFSGV